ncbi:MAG: hypothetical protein WDW38_002053 [Sanguina aurantia]
MHPCRSSGVANAQEDVTVHLADSFHIVQHPAAANRTYSRAMKDYTSAAILAYECGSTQDGIRAQLHTLLQGLIVRWSTSEAVGASDMGQWRGFCSHIVNAYFEKRMAWYPLDRLQLELAAHGRGHEAREVIAERARLVYTVLEHVCPQFAAD